MMIGEIPVCKPWSPAKIRGVVWEVPRPISCPAEYITCFRNVAELYDCFVPNVELMLQFTYKNEWDVYEEENTFASPIEVGQWPPRK